MATPLQHNNPPNINPNLQSGMPPPQGANPNPMQLRNFDPKLIPQQRLASLIHRANQLRASGATAENNQELQRIMMFMNAYRQAQATTDSQQQNQGQQPTTNGHPPAPQQHMSMPNGANNNNMNNAGPAPLTPAAVHHPLTHGPVPTHPNPNPPQSPVSFTPNQINSLRVQIYAFKRLQRGLPIPEPIQQAIRNPNQVIPDLERILQGIDGPDAKVVDSAVKIHKAVVGEDGGATEGPKSEDAHDAAGGDVPKGPFLEDLVDSGIYPYNSYVHPFTHLQRTPDTNPALFASRLQRLLVPSIMPSGLDPHQIIAERNRYIDARIEQRMRELEAMPATMGDGGLDGIVEQIAGEEEEAKTKEEPNPDLQKLAHPSPNAHGKLRAMIELKSLRVLDKQRALRALVAERLTHGSLLPLNRADFRRTRRPQIKDARITEQLERKQRSERELRAKQKHVDQLEVICAHGREVVAANRAAQDRVVRLGKAVLSFHAHTEKEEQKRVERISKERLKALKADDEEAYMKLIDTAKDTRITHLLRQTDSYLDSLAQAVMAQQSEADKDQNRRMGIDRGFEEEVGPASEETFGASKAIEDEPVEGDGKKLDYYAVAHRVKEKISKQPSILVGGTLKDYQLKGLQWMVSLYNNRLNGILADEMGLGKTIQTISLITFLIESKRERGPYLVIVPLSTMTNWSGEFAKWAPSVRMISYKGSPQQRKGLQNEIRMGNYQVLLTTYEYIIKDRPALSKTKWHHIIIDEGHRMKNTQSKLSQTLTQYYHSRYRLILTGTPLQNNLPELWALLNFVLPKIFNSVKSFDEWFNTPFANSGTGDKIELNEEEALLIIRRLHKVLRPFLLRRLKKDVEAELPDKVEKVIKVKMSALQAQLYKQMKKYKMIADGKETKGKSGGVKGLSNELMQLRKICQHPFLFESVEDKINPSGLIDDKIIRSAGKIELLSRILPKFFATDHRVLIFFQMTKVMDIMEDFLKMMGYKYLRLDGGTKTDERAGHVQLFNAPNSEFKVFILSTRAGGLGLNLQSADTVIIFDSDWNPHADLQAQDRAHRIGQTKTVRILRFITEKSVEEAMYARARYKLDIDDKVIQAGRFDNKSTVEEQEEFLRSILEADQEDDAEEAGTMDDDEINEIIARNDNEVIVFKDMDFKRERESEAAWRAAGNRGKPPPLLMQLEELPDCYQNDEPFDASIDELELEGRGHRRRNVVNYNDGLSDEQFALAVEEGEDLSEVAGRNRDKKDRRLANKLLRETEVSGAATPVSETDSRGRKGRKGKAKMVEPDFEPPAGKRKRGIKSVSVTPSINNDDEDEERDNKRRKTKVPDVPPAVRERMKKAFSECYKAVFNCADETGRKRCELFKELPDKRDYPDYYQLIQSPIAMSHLRKRSSTNYYKDVQQFKDDWKLMFNNARTYNQEGSWVYIDAEEMEKVFDATFERVIAGSGLPGAPPAAAVAAGSSGYGDNALTPVEDDERPLPPPRGSSRKQILSDDDYLTPSEDD